MKRTQLYFLFFWLIGMLGCDIVETDYLLPQPKSFSATSIKSTGFTANWEEMTGAEGYFVDVAIDAGFENIVSGYNSVLVNADSLVVEGLEVATSYYYRVRVNYGDYISDYSDYVVLKTERLKAPEEFVLYSVDAGAFRVKWNDVEGAETYLVTVSEDADFSTNLPDYLNREVTSSLLTVTGLTNGKYYYYKVAAKNRDFISMFSKDQSIFTSELSVPDDILIKNISHTSFNMSWLDYKGIDSYIIDVSDEADFVSPLEDYNSLSIADTSLRIDGLTPNTLYYIRLRGSASSGVSGYAYINVYTQKLSVVEGLQSDSVGYGGIVVSWQEESEDLFYLVDVSTSADFTETLPAYDGLEVSTNSLLIKDLSAATQYYIRVRKEGSGSVSDYSEVISVTTLTVPAPTNIQVEATESTMDISWEGDENALAYMLDIASDPDFENILPDYHEMVVTKNSISVSSLMPGTTYYIRIMLSLSYTTLSGYSDVAVVTTKEIPTPEINNSSRFAFTAQVDWTEVSLSEQYYVDVATDTDFLNMVPGYDGFESLTNSIKLTGLNPLETYYVRVRNFYRGAETPYSSTLKLSPLYSETYQLEAIKDRGNSSFVWEFSYSAGRKLATVTSASSNHSSDVYDVTYSGDKVTRISNGTEQQRMTYNGELLEELEVLKNGVLEQVLVYGYSTAGQLTGISIFSDFAKTQLVNTYEFTYTGNNISLIQDANGSEFSNTYDENLNVYTLLPSELAFFMANNQVEKMAEILSNNNRLLNVSDDSEEVCSYDYNQISLPVKRYGVEKWEYIYAE